MSTAPALRVFLLLLLISLLSGCASLLKPWLTPEVALLQLQPKALGLTRQVLVATLAVRNPNDRTLPIKAMTYQIGLEGQDVAAGGGALAQQIPAFGEATVEVEVNGDVLTLVRQLPALALKKQPLAWSIAGTVTIADGLLILPYRYAGTVDARQLLAGVK
jgi:LEA14-like dessication related protein